MKIKKYTCQKCGSSNTQRCAIAYQQGVSTGFGGETSISDIARRSAPPASPGLWKSWRTLVICLPVALVFFWIAATTFKFGGISVSSVGTSVIFGCSLYLMVGAIKHLKLGPVVKQNYEHDLDLYERLWICRDCGHIYEVQDPH